MSRMDLAPFWSDPIADLAETPEHPSVSTERVLSDVTSGIGSTFSSINPAESAKNAYLAAIATYTKARKDDDTLEVLKAFVDNLPSNGSARLMGEIGEFANDPTKIRMLRKFLVDALIKPSMIPPTNT